MTHETEIEDNIKTIIIESLRLNHSETNLNYSSLLNQHIINSVTIMEILVNLESQFNIEFSDDEIDLKFFRSFNDLKNLVLTKIKYYKEFPHDHK